MEQALETEDPGRVAKADEAFALARAVRAVVRSEFEAPVAAITGLIEIVLEDAVRDGGSRHVGDLETMRSAAHRLAHFITSMLDTADFEQSFARHDADAVASALRHDLRTPLTVIIGYGELVAEEAREDVRSSLLGPLEDALDAARRLLGHIDGMVVFVGMDADGSGPVDDGARADQPLVQQAIQTVRAVLRDAPEIEPGIMGRILVVDSNVSTLDLLSRRLARDGHRAQTAETGAAGLALVASGQFDLVLLDLMLPDVSGLDVLRRLKTNPATAPMPVVMTSALDEVATAVRCIEAGADDYLAKPVNTVLLRARIAASLDRKFLRDREIAITQALRAEQERSEALLRNVLPEVIVERLRDGETDIADPFEDVTILFCDLVGFTNLASSLQPAATLALLNGIFSGFDSLAAEFGLEKIKTMGDSYMAAGGLPERRADHAAAVADMALRMPEVVRQVSLEVGQRLDVRIGLHSGPVVAGIIGTQKFVYDVWGDTVNIASRMEHLSEPGRIQVSGATRTALGPDYLFEERSPLHVKGKGTMQTFFLVGRRDGARTGPPPLAQAPASTSKRPESLVGRRPERR
jgi:class 3 adenylate cyclase/signal transduction histidine kinase